VFRLQPQLEHASAASGAKALAQTNAAVMLVEIVHFMIVPQWSETLRRT
jgi:hypothetical protein